MALSAGTKLAPYEGAALAAVTAVFAVYFWTRRAEVEQTLLTLATTS
jgi:hypothetical protein